MAGAIVLSVEQRGPCGHGFLITAVKGAEQGEQNFDKINGTLDGVRWQENMDLVEAGWDDVPEAYIKRIFFNQGPF